MKVLARNDNTRHTLFPGDTLVAHIHGQEVARHDIDKAMTVDTILIVQVEEGELGLESGVGAIFGKKAEPKRRRWKLR